MLVVIVGPIASGKSTIAEALGRELRASGRRVAVLDLDDVVESIGGFVGLPPEHFHDAQLVFGQLVGNWLERGVDVIAHGPFVEPEENAALLHALPAGTRPVRVLLTTPFPVALERVSADPTRMLAEHPEVLESFHERFDQHLAAMPPADRTFDTSALDVRQIVEQLIDGL